MYNIPLKDLEQGVHKYEYLLQDKFFEDIDAPLVKRGEVNVIVTVTRNSHAFELDFEIDGIVKVPCDRCLADMDIPIEAQEHLTVKFGDAFSEESDTIVVIPESEGAINLAWFIYEFVALCVPIRNVHPTGQCSKSMVSKLRKHLIVEKEEGEDAELFDDLGEMDEETEEAEVKTDPRWDALKSLLDNN